MLVRSGSGTVRWLAVATVFAAAALFLVMSALPASAETGSLTAEQESRATSIEGKLIAPCCYTQTVAVHESQKAEEIKMQVRLLLAQGKTDGEIIDGFVSQYGEQILAAPRASGFNWLAYLLPVLVVFFAVGGVAVLVMRWREGRGLPEPVPVRSRDDAADADPRRRRLEDELSHYDP